MQTLHTLTAARGLVLRCDTEARWQIGWSEPDWLGPVGVLAHHGNAAHAGGKSDPPSGDQTGVQPIHLRAGNVDACDGSDDLGDYRGLTLGWDGLPLAVRTSVRAYRATALIVFRIEAPTALHGLSTGVFEQPSIAWPTFSPAARCAGGVPDGTRTYGHQYTEFALPVSGDALCTGFFFAPHRPSIVEPLLFIAADGRTLLLAPLDHFHEQVIAVPKDRDHVMDGIRCGWHGDLSAVPAGFATELALWAAESPRQALEIWTSVLRRRHGTQRRSRYADPGIGTLSYWTDNGAYYYYRTAADCDYTATLERAVADLHAREIPVRAAQLDSWFYPHEHLRPVSPEGAPIVPPSGMLTWSPRADLFPDGFGTLRQRLGDLPLTFHSRHFSRQSPYFAQQDADTRPDSAHVRPDDANGLAYDAYAHPDETYAHPRNGDLFELLMEQARSWGAVTYEQDWMVESFLGVRGLRAEPGRAAAWQQRLDRAAGEHGLTLQWCMASPPDFLQTVTLRNVTSIRTSGDYRYLFDNGLNWVWFLHTNALARALGLHPFKDTFISNSDPARGHAEPYAEAEALLASLSAGPVAIGDQIGCADRAIVMRVCREDGVLIKPDVALAALDRCFRASSYFEPAPLIAETYSEHPAGRWVYVASFNASQARQPLHFRVALADLGTVRPRGAVLLYDWRARHWSHLDPDAGWECTLGFQEWDYRVLCPLLAGDVTVFGDVGKYATVGDRRVAHITADDPGLRFDVLGAPGTWVDVDGYAAQSPCAVSAWVPQALRHLARQRGSTAHGEWWSWDARTGGWRMRVCIGPCGRTRVALATR